MSKHTHGRARRTPRHSLPGTADRGLTLYASNLHLRVTRSDL